MPEGAERRQRPSAASSWFDPEGLLAKNELMGSVRGLPQEEQSQSFGRKAAAPARVSKVDNTRVALRGSGSTVMLLIFAVLLLFVKSIQAIGDAPAKVALEPDVSNINNKEAPRRGGFPGEGQEAIHQHSDGSNNPGLNSWAWSVVQQNQKPPAPVEEAQTSLRSGAWRDVSIENLMEALGSAMESQHIVWRLPVPRQLVEMATADAPQEPDSCVGCPGPVKIEKSFTALLSGISVRNSALLLEFSRGFQRRRPCWLNRHHAADQEERENCPRDALQLEALPAADLDSRSTVQRVVGLFDSILRRLDAPATSLSILQTDAIIGGPLILKADLSVPSLIMTCSNCGPRDTLVLVNSPEAAQPEKREGQDSKVMRWKNSSGFTSDSFLIGFLEWELGTVGAPDKTPEPLPEPSDVKLPMLPSEENRLRRIKDAWRIREHKLAQLRKAIYNVQEKVGNELRVANRLIGHAVFDFNVENKWLPNDGGAFHTIKHTLREWKSLNFRSWAVSALDDNFQRVSVTGGRLHHLFGSMGAWSSLSLADKTFWFVFDPEMRTLSFYYQPLFESNRASLRGPPGSRAVYTFTAFLTESQFQDLKSLPQAGEFRVGFDPNVVDLRFAHMWRFLFVGGVADLILLVLVIGCCWLCCCRR